MTAYHSELTTQSVGEIAEGQHADDSTGECDRADDGAIVVSVDGVSTVDTLQDCKELRITSAPYQGMNVLVLTVRRVSISCTRHIQRADNSPFPMTPLA